MSPTALDTVLTATAARWVQGERRLGPADIEVAVADGPPLAQPVHPWIVTNALDDLVTYRRCWRDGRIALPLPRHPPPGLVAGAEAAATRLPVDAAVVLATSGSTGGAKGVVHTHAGLIGKARQMVEVHGLTTDDVVLMPAPLSHMSGLLNGLLVPGLAGMTTVLMARWDPSAALTLIEREGVSFMVGPPTFFVDLWRAPDFGSHRVASLRLVSCGGAGVTPAFVAEAEHRLGAVVKRTYGSTEAPTVSTTPAAEHDDPRRATTDGRATPGTELRVVDDELQVRGPELFAGYLDAAETDAAMTPDGWYRTGDRATLDGDGWLTVTGRLRDLIIRGGENVAPASVEALLEAHPAVHEAVVVGLPDERLGERIVAAVVPVPGTAPPDPATVRAWFVEQGAAPFLAPERIDPVPSLPRLASGKPDRAAVRDRIASGDDGAP